jgi:hypothetical protein
MISGYCVGKFTAGKQLSPSLIRRNVTHSRLLLHSVCLSPSLLLVIGRSITVRVTCLPGTRLQVKRERVGRRHKASFYFKDITERRQCEICTELPTKREGLYASVTPKYDFCSLDLRTEQTEGWIRHNGSSALVLS